MLHYPVELWLITLHLIGDFPLQPNGMAKNKEDSPSVRFTHSLIHGLLFLPLGLFIYPRLSGGLLFALWIFASHFIIDSRRWTEPNEEWENPEMWVWINDQILHFIALGASFWVVELIRPTPL